MLIDATYFIGQLNIAQVDQETVRDNLDVFITKYEAKFLIQLLGKTLYDEFLVGLDDPQPDQIWIDLKEMLLDETLKQSPIANYVYYFYSEDNATQTTGVSEVLARAENASYHTPIHKMMRAWNEMVVRVLEIRKWLTDNLVTYPNLIIYSYPYLNNWNGYYDHAMCGFPEIVVFKNRFGI